MTIRQPIITLVGHVDHGKSSILDFIRKTNIISQEAGGITQKISSSSIPMESIKQISGELLNSLKIKLTIPGMLFVDTPGHAAFNSLRKRGGNLADIAILVIDIREGIMPQTSESIEILKNYKTPFIIALNKIDNISGYQSKPNLHLLKNLQSQSEMATQEVESKLYNIVAKLSELGINSERFDRVDDYTKQIAIIPCSAKTGEGIPELLMVLSGLAQKYLEKSLKIKIKGPAKGTILEIKEEKGLGKTIDVIIYDGTLNKNDKIAIATLDKPIITKVKGLFTQEKGILKPKDSVTAASGVIINAANLDKAISGMPLQAIKNNLAQVKKELKESVEEVLIETEKDGIIIKADTLGSLEALTLLLKEKNIQIKRASIGDINKKDISESKSEKEKSNKVILGFNIKNTLSTEVKIITNNIIYKIIEDYELWKIKERAQEEAKVLQDITSPAKVQILRGCIFRQSNPAVVGIKIMGGKLKKDSALMKEDGSKCGTIKSIQDNGENIPEAIKNQEVAISIPHIIVGRQIDEDYILYSDISEDDFSKLKKLKKFLKPDEIEVLKEIIEIKRKSKPLWGV